MEREIKKKREPVQQWTKPAKKVKGQPAEKPEPIPLTGFQENLKEALKDYVDLVSDEEPSVEAGLSGSMLAIVS